MPAERRDEKKSWFAQTPNDNPKKILFVAFAVAFVCALAVSASTILLRPLYNANIEKERQGIILDLMQGFLPAGKNFESLRVISRVIRLEDGKPDPSYDPASFDSERVPAITLSEAENPAGMQRLEKSALVHEVMDARQLVAVVLPVRGRGYASTISGYLAIGGDGTSILGIKFFSHGETPGIGGRIDEKSWLAQWRGKRAYDSRGRIRIQVVKGASANERGKEYRVHAISGATFTSQGIHILIRFWLGPKGFGPYLRRLRAAHDAGQGDVK